VEVRGEVARNGAIVRPATGTYVIITGQMGFPFGVGYLTPYGQAVIKSAEPL